jgi:UDP-glucose 4-epimerase
MDVVVTGADGFLGKHLCPRLARAHRIFAVTRAADRPPAGNLLCVHADLQDPSFERALPSRADAVIALAQSRHYRQFPEKALDIFAVNATSLLRLLDWSRQVGVSKFVYASSANVYASGPAPLREEDAPAPGAFYGRSKYIGELLVGSYAAFFHCTMLRLFTVYGPGQTGMLIPHLIERVRAGQAIQVEGRTGLRLSPVYVADVCRVIEAVLAESSAPTAADLLNVGGDEAVAMGELAQTIASVLGARAHLEYLDRPEPGGWVADCRRLRARFELGPFRSVAQGLRDTIHGDNQRRAAG